MDDNENSNLPKKGKKNKVVTNDSLPSWACFDGDFSSLTEWQKILLSQKYMASGKQFTEELDEFFEKAKAEERLFNILKKHIPEDKTHFVIGGGSYTYRFILPWIFKFLVNRFPLIPFELKMIEMRGAEDYPENVDLMLTSLYDDQDFFKIPETFHTHIFLRDEVHLITSHETFAKYNHDVQSVFDNVPLIYSRFYTDSTFTKEIAPPPYYALFNRYLKQRTRLTVNIYYMAFEFMLFGRGVLQGFSSMPDKRKVVYLTENPLSLIDRYFVYNRDSDFTEEIVIALMNNKNEIFPKNETQLLQAFGK